MKIMKENNIYYNEDFKTINDAISLIRKSEIVVSPDTAIIAYCGRSEKGYYSFLFRRQEELWKMEIIK